MVYWGHESNMKTMAYLLSLKVCLYASGWTWDLFQEWGLFFKIAIFGLVMVCMEWWSFEIGVIVAGG